MNRVPAVAIARLYRIVHVLLVNKFLDYLVRLVKPLSFAVANHVSAPDSRLLLPIRSNDQTHIQQLPAEAFTQRRPSTHGQQFRPHDRREQRVHSSRISHVPLNQINDTVWIDT